VLTYALVAGAVLVPVAAVALVVLVRLGRPALRAAGMALAVLLALTAVFDNVIVGTGIVGYHPARILGLRIGVAPIEDFAYPIAAALALPALWWGLPGRHRKPPC
jgi:lycopene cyclase domain-containing protein